MRYDNFTYIYPPRALHTIHPQFLSTDRFAGHIAQPKLNGDCTTIFTNGIETIIMDRYGKPFKKAIPMKEKLQKLHRGPIGKWMMLVGEHMNIGKGKKNAQGQPWVDKFVIFDIIVYDGIHLIGQTFKQRIELLDQLYGTMRYINDPYLLSTEHEDIFRVRSFYNHKEYGKLWLEVTAIDMYEGLVLKEADAPLYNGLSEKNNTDSQAKSRKPTKGYPF